MRDYFTRVSDGYSYNTRQSLFNFVVPTHSGRNTFSVTAIKDWNALPSNIKSISSLSVFKKKESKVTRFTKSHAINREILECSVFV